MTWRLRLVLVVVGRPGPAGRIRLCSTAATSRPAGTPSTSTTRPTCSPRARGSSTPTRCSGRSQVVPGATHPPLWTLVLALAAVLGSTTFFGQLLWSCVIGAAVGGGRGHGGARGGGASRRAHRGGHRRALPRLSHRRRVAVGRDAGGPARGARGVGLLPALAPPSLPSGRPPRRAVRLVRADPVRARAPGRVPGSSRRARVPGPIRGAGAWPCAAWLWSGRVCVFAPWWAYTVPRFSHTELLSDQLGVTLASANCDPTYSGKFLGYWDDQCEVAILTPKAEDASVRDADLRQRRPPATWSTTPDACRWWWRPGWVGRWGVFRPGQEIDLEWAVLGPTPAARRCRPGLLLRAGRAGCGRGGGPAGPATAAPALRRHPGRGRRRERGDLRPDPVPHSARRGLVILSRGGHRPVHRPALVAVASRRRNVPAPTP